VERDVGANEAYRARLRELNPKRSLPTFDVDGEVVVGFSPSSLDRAIVAAAERRLARE